MPFLDKTIACDASGDSSFGVSALPCPIEVVQSVGRRSERRGDFKRLHRKPGEPEPKDRLGNAHRLGFRKSDFQTILSKRCKFKAHSSVLEGHALLLTVRWAIRNHMHHNMHHNKQIVMLVDAKFIIGAASKGRTSAPALRGVVRQLAALLLGSNCIVYIPTDENPADAPSRGKLFRPRRRIKKVSPKRRANTRFKRYVERMVPVLQRVLKLTPGTMH